MENLKKDEIKEEVKQNPEVDVENKEEDSDNFDFSLDFSQFETEGDAEGDTLTPSEEESDAEQHEGAADDLGQSENGEENVSENGESEEQHVDENLRESMEDDSIGETQEDVTTQEPVEKMLTQSQVNELVGKARQEGRMAAMKELLSRYGVDTEDEMNDIFGRGQAYDTLNDDYIGQGYSLKNVMAENALLKSGIIPDRWDDVKLILSGKGLDVSEEEIANLLPTHPEWTGSNNGGENGPKMFSPEMGEQLVKKVPEQTEQPGTLTKLGNPVQPNAPIETEEEKVARLFGIK